MYVDKCESLYESDINFMLAFLCLIGTMFQDHGSKKVATLWCCLRKWEGNPLVCLSRQFTMTDCVPLLLLREVGMKSSWCTCNAHMEEPYHPSNSHPLVTRKALVVPLKSEAAMPQTPNQSWRRHAWVVGAARYSSLKKILRAVAVSPQ
ncbi:hypothetical protein EJ110_NYTH54347 [Nymphaea thermarum]|nr:hypothetical protein EJ110_NYTH54347 [Nymphaea thermarum]